MATYTASTAIIPNPERGYFQYTETHYNSDNSGYVPLSASNLSSTKTSTVQLAGIDFTARTIVFRYFYIEKYKTVATIDQTYLNLVAADLAAVRSAGCKIILRFAYLSNQNSDSDATPSMVRSHIQQLAGTLNQYADIIIAIEAGFVGAWGEWYYTNNFGDQGTLTSQNVSDRNSVIDALLNNVDSRVFILLRYMGTRQTYLNTTNPNPGGNAVRLGHHNDAFTMPYADYGTYTTFSTQDEATNRTYLQNIANIPVGGESAGYNPPNSDWANASSELATYKWSFLNPNYYAQTINAWGQTNNDTASKLLGYRLRMVSSNIPTSLSANASATVQVVIANDGWAAPLRNRPVQFVFDDGNGHVSTSAFSTDVRTWAPGGQVTLSMNVTAPGTSGTYNTYLVLPDASSPIATNPAYNIQMANTNTWDAATGRNSLANPVTVGGGGGSPSPTASLSNVTTSITVGSAASATMSLGNASSAYVVLYTNGAEQGGRIQAAAGSISLTPSGAGSYTIRVYTSASGGTLLAESPTITVSAAASVSGSFSNVPGSVAVNTPISATFSFSGASTAYITLVSNGVEQGPRVSVSPGSFQITPTSTGTFVLRGYTSSSGGTLIAESPQISVTSTASVTATFTGLASSIVIGDHISGNVAVSNGSVIYIVLYMNGSEQGGRTGCNPGSWGLLPQSTGTFTVRAFSANTGGTLLGESPSFTVTAASSGGSGIKRVFKLTVNGVTKTVKLT